MTWAWGDPDTPGTRPYYDQRLSDIHETTEQITSSGAAVPQSVRALEAELRAGAVRDQVEPLAGNLAAWVGYQLVSDCRRHAGLDGQAVGLAWREAECVLRLHGPELGIELWAPDVHLKLRRIEALRLVLEADLRADRRDREQG